MTKHKKVRPMSSTKLATRNPGVIAVSPSARRLMTSMRDIGYNPSTAIADLVDNSISAGAKRVDVDISFQGSRSRIAVADDGSGMSALQLDEALRFGSRRGYEASDLGRFGLGLKTAGLSLGRRVSVLSRNTPARPIVRTRVLDLDHVSEVDRWEVLTETSPSNQALARSSLSKTSGTVVVVEQLDRILPEEPDSGWAKRRFTSVETAIKQYLALVFHRFIEGQAGAPLKLSVNGELLEPWNPFAPKEPATQELERQTFELETDIGMQTVTYHPWVLPPRNQFSSQEEFERLSGPKRWNRQQGLYVYRADRLVQGGGWAGLRGIDEHTKLARAAVHFDSRLDDAFKIDVAKMRVRLPLELKKSMERAVNELCHRADNAYRSASREVTKPDTVDVSPSKGDREIALALSLAAYDIDEFESLTKIMQQLRKVNPELAEQLGW